MGEFELVTDFSYLATAGTATFVTSLIIFKFIGPYLSSRLTSSYDGLSESQKADWNDRLMSNFNAVLSVLCAYSLIYDEGMSKDYVWYNSPIARISCSIVIGYMCAGIVVMMLWTTLPRNELLGYIAHHLVTIYAYYYVSVNGVLCYFAMLRLVAEFSTLNMNQRWYFDVCKFPRSNPIVVLNGFAMVVTFFFFRIVTMPIFWYRIWSVSGTEASAALGHIQLIMYIPCVVLDSLNVMWFYKMCRGFVKAVRALQNSKQNHSA